MTTKLHVFQLSGQWHPYPVPRVRLIIRVWPSLLRILLNNSRGQSCYTVIGPRV